MTWTEGRQTADNSLMRFVSRRFFSPATCLDIGSGEGANARELIERNHVVKALDKDEWCVADYHRDVREFDGHGGPYDLIYDVNTLCHVEDPPFEKIRSWLKPEGIFFSICPTDAGPKYIDWGKPYTRRITEFGLREMLQPFFKEIRIRWRSEPGYRYDHDQLESWLVEARP